MYFVIYLINAKAAFLTIDETSYTLAITNGNIIS